MSEKISLDSSAGQYKFTDIAVGSGALRTDGLGVRIALNYLYGCFSSTLISLID